MDQLILSYHGVSSQWNSALALPERVLAEQLGLLRQRGYEGMTFREFARRRGSGELPRRSLVVTFDDGYASTLKALPVLEALGMPATVFPVLSFVESGEPLCWPGIEEWLGTAHRNELEPLSWEELERLVEAGWEVGSHTVTHPKLPEIDDDALRAELTDSRAGLAARLGGCDTIAYPYGLADERVAGATGQAGYLAGCTLSRFHLADEPYRRPRVGLYSTDSGARLKLKMSALGSTVRRSRLLARLSGADELG